MNPLLWWRQGHLCINWILLVQFWAKLLIKVREVYSSCSLQILGMLRSMLEFNGSRSSWRTAEEDARRLSLSICSTMLESESFGLCSSIIVMATLKPHHQVTRFPDWSICFFCTSKAFSSWHKSENEQILLIKMLVKIFWYIWTHAWITSTHYVAQCRLAEGTRKAAAAWGLKLLCKDERWRSDSLTVIEVPEVSFYQYP